MNDPWAITARRENLVCDICPALDLPLGQFDVGTPRGGSRWDPTIGCRINTDTKAPTCIHPASVGLPVADYTAGAPIPIIDTVTAVLKVENPDDASAAWLAYRQGPLTGRD